jgi:lysozyme family protein
MRVFSGARIMDVCDQINRRRVLGGLSSSAIGAATLRFSGQAVAQALETDPLTNGLQQRLISLEQRASELALPDTGIVTRGPRQPINAGNSYRVSMPRLVDLIDRSGFGALSREIADAAGELLSNVHRQQRSRSSAVWATRPRPSPSAANWRVEYRRMFEECRIRPECRSAIASNLWILRRYRSRYERLGNQVRIPWYFIGIIHGLEASFSFVAHLHNGDYPLEKRTVSIPRNRPAVWMPPSDWETSAKDALHYDGFIGETDWSLEAILYRWEAFNGFGYRRREIPSPYLWSFSQHYDRGKFASDGKYDPQLKSQQCGAAVMLKELIRSGDIQRL